MAAVCFSLFARVSSLLVLACVIVYLLAFICGNELLFTVGFASSPPPPPSIAGLLFPLNVNRRGFASTDFDCRWSPFIRSIVFDLLSLDFCFLFY